MAAEIKLIPSAIKSFLARKAAKVRADRKAMFWIRYACRWLIVGLALVAYTLAVSNAATRRAISTYEGWIAEYAAEQEAEAARAFAEDPYQLQLDAEAESVARVLYGVKDNDTDDLKTYSWCIFNRVENKAFPDTLEDVIAQPKQWMRYDPENPIIESLYQLAREQLDAWHSNSHRPVSADYVYMNWTASDICLRDAWLDGSGTHYWRYGQ